VSPLEEELRRTLDVLVDEVPRRRWGRALSYFIDRLPVAADPAIADTARDILNMLLPGKDGLRTNASKLSPAIAIQVGRLEQECRRILQGGPVRPFGIGIVDAGQSPQADEVKCFRQLLHSAEQEIAGADLTVAPILQLAGTFKTLTEPYGLRPGRLGTEQRIASMSVGVPPQLRESDLREFLVQSLEDAVIWSERALARKGVAWSLEPNRAVIARLKV
jgi:hypothetical protein